jgi:hypothetical protein
MEKYTPVHVGLSKLTSTKFLPGSEREPLENR